MWTNHPEYLEVESWGELYGKHLHCTQGECLGSQAGYFTGSPELPGQAPQRLSMSGGNYWQICSEPPEEIQFCF